MRGAGRAAATSAMVARSRDAVIVKDTMKAAKEEEELKVLAEADEERAWMNRKRRPG